VGFENKEETQNESEGQKKVTTSEEPKRWPKPRQLRKLRKRNRLTKSSSSFVR
jgi:hypothetical protein